jgi:hypothetical protein
MKKLLGYKFKIIVPKGTLPNKQPKQQYDFGDLLEQNKSTPERIQPSGQIEEEPIIKHEFKEYKYSPYPGFIDPQYVARSIRRKTYA